MHQFSDVIKHFGGISGLAAALECTTQAISQWDELIPEQRAYQIEVLSKGKFKASRLPVKKRGQAPRAIAALS
jgi:transcriptional repressor of cell division inhibition gene dicB